MRTEVIEGVTVRPLRNGETQVVQAVFDRLGPRSRYLRFHGAKNVLNGAELDRLARVDTTHHVLVALKEGEPIGIARLVRSGAEAEVAFAVVDDWQGKGVGRVLVDRLAADARAAGVACISASVQPGNAPSQALVRRLRATVPACV